MAIMRKRKKENQTNEVKFKNEKLEAEKIKAKDKAIMEKSV